MPKNIRKFVEGDESRREKKHTAQQNTAQQSQRAKIIHRVVHFVCAVDSLEWNGNGVFSLVCDAALHSIIAIHFHGLGLS